MHYLPHEEHHEQDQRQLNQPVPAQQGAQTQFFPGFPGVPGFPFPGTDLNQRVRRLEERQFQLEGEVNRLQRQVAQLERRVVRLEGGGGGYFPWGATGQ